MSSMLLFSTSDHSIFPFIDRDFTSTPPREKLWRDVKACYSMEVSHKGFSLNDPGSVKFKKTVLKCAWLRERILWGFFHVLQGLSFGFLTNKIIFMWPPEMRRVYYLSQIGSLGVLSIIIVKIDNNLSTHFISVKYLT